MPAEGGEGYRVYRRREGTPFGHEPVAALGPNELSYRDTGLLNGLTYHYVVRAIRKVDKTWVEGTGTEEVSLTPKDLTPPETPSGLVAIPLPEGIELSWRRNVEPDLLGYAVYRRYWGESEYMRLNETLLAAPAYVDRSAVVGQAYEYVVTAVDSSPKRNESSFSRPARVKYVR
jgi:fibronectin type 3 domain-containing protein